MDPIANMLVTIKNGYMAHKPQVTMPYSKFKLEIAKVLEKEGFVGKVEKTERQIAVDLLYENKSPKVTQIKKISKPGLRIYTRSKNIQKIKGGRGMSIVSTPSGVMTGKDAKEKKLGGEVICEIW